MKKDNQKSQIVIYKNENGQVKIDVRFDGDTVWLTQETIASLYDKGRSTVTEHIQNIFIEGELAQDSVCREYRRTGADGKKYLVKFYNLDLIIAVGYRVKSTQGTAFRKWATKTLRQHIYKGFTIVILEAKKEDKNPLDGKEQARRYVHTENVLFEILSNGNLHYFRDLERGNPEINTRKNSLFIWCSKICHYKTP